MRVPHHKPAFQSIRNMVRSQLEVSLVPGKRQCSIGGAFLQKREVGRGALRAFDRAVKVAAQFAADAGVMQIQLREDSV